MFKIVKYFTVIITLLACNNIVVASNYSMPIGIPDTDLNFTQELPSRPSNWDQQVEGYYYINYAEGSNSNGFGSESQPRKTLPNPLPAGSYVEIAGDYSYTSGGVIKIYAEGTNENWVAGKSGPVWITSSIADDAFFIQKKVVVWGENLYLTNINSKEGSKIQVGSAASGYSATNIVIRNSEISGTLTSGTGALLSAIGASATDDVQNIIFFNNIIRDAGDIDSLQDDDSGLIVINGYASYIWVLNNTGYNASGTALQINTSPPKEASQYIFAGHNEFYNVRQSGLWVKYAKNVVFSENYIHNIISTEWSPGKGLGAQYEPDGLWIINNRVHDVAYGIRVNSFSTFDTPPKVYIIGNILYNIHTQLEVGTQSAWESAAMHLNSVHEKHIYNNLIFNAPNGINISSRSGMALIKNNIIHQLTNSHQEGASGYHIWSEQLIDNEDISISNNYFSPSSIKIRLASNVITDPQNLDSPNNISNDTQITTDNIETIIGQVFEDENTWNNDNTWDKGTDVYTVLNDSFLELAKGSDIITKIDYEDNKKGLNIDIGPFERTEANSSLSLPNPPANVSVINNQ